MGGIYNVGSGVARASGTSGTVLRTEDGGYLWQACAVPPGGEPMDKAGAHAIRGRAARWIPRIEACYFNVMGLPLALVCSLLEPCNSLL